MADVLGILSAAYRKTAPVTAGKYVAVDPNAYKGGWEGKYSNGKSFKVDVSQISGFRAQVKYESAGTVKYQQVLIKDDTFRVGDTKFTLSKTKKGDIVPNKAIIKNVVTDAATGTTFLDTATAVRTG
ncbi:hypothetical protein [Rhodopseudomonas sp. P2A-2r]|uniref:hypothetical protein n=1 Tax=unclassified Rhodopseudomonas TaxID=2638247 RepID=UPI0022341B25|nr:hypothetical protein [Rhodopseudomonas sp. P2A-2r]UZE51313.1 hypothetical protein ONR75_12280 [Rhodopseudomonas sp. P2A-2r]